VTPDRTDRFADRISVLVTDDHPDLRRAVRLALESEGFDAEDAADGAKALVRLRERHFDVLVADVRMPGLDGYQLLGEMEREQLRTRTVMFSVLADEQSRRRAAGLGAVAFLEKPFALDDLLDAVRTAAGSSAGAPAKVTPCTRMTRSAGSSTPSDSPVGSSRWTSTS
jgi:DNA-binding response OmpR family regulator